MFSKDRSTNMYASIQARPSGQDTAETVMEDAAPMFCTRKYK